VPAARIGWGLAFLTAAFLLPRVLSLLGLGVSLVAWPWQFDYDEGINLNATLQLAEGRNIYRHNGPEEFISAPYPPFFYILNAPVAAIAGPYFGFGRALSLLSTLAIAVLLAYIVRRVTSTWYGGLIAAALWLSLSPVIVWSSLYKQDMPALALGLAGLALALSRPRGLHLYGAALLFALAFYTKQSALAAAAATVLWLLVRDPSTGLRLIASLLGLVAVPFFGVNLLLGGGLWEHLVGNHVLPWEVGRMRQALTRLWGEHWPLLVWGGAALGGMIIIATTRVSSLRAKLANPWGLMGLYALVGLASTLAQVGYEGANYNHLLDGLLVLSLLAGLSVAWLLSRVGSGEPEKRAWAVGELVLIGALVLAQLFAFNDPRTWYRGGFWPSAERESEMRGLSDLVARTPGDIYTEDAYLALRNNKPLVYDDPSTFVPLAEGGGWDSSALTQSLRDRRFGLVLLMSGSVRWTDDGEAAFRDNYSLKFPGSIDAYEPKLVPDSAQYPLQCELSSNVDRALLNGYSLAPGVARNGLAQGDTLRVSLYWQVPQPLQQSYASFLHVLDDKGESVAARDNPETGAGRPTTTWEPGKTITDTTAIPLPAEAAPGRYRLVTGMYRVQSGALESLSARCDRGEAYGDAVSLGWVEIR
jgi:hypothetical protein